MIDKSKLCVCVCMCVCVCVCVLAVPSEAHDLELKVTDFEILRQRFVEKFYKCVYFPNQMLDLVHIRHDNRVISKISLSNTLLMLMIYKSGSLSFLALPPQAINL